MVIKRILRKLPTRVRKLFGRYRPERYWKNRHLQYGMDFRGVGNCTLSAKQNEQTYVQAREVVLRTCSRIGIDWNSVRVLDIGCGNGFYTALFDECGVKSYTGVDITDVLFPDLQKRFPQYQFVQLDVTGQKLPDLYDLIVMIDVTQHIVSPRRFRRAMKNIWTHLKSGGWFLVTSWLTEQTIRRQLHEVARPLAAYQKTFPEAEFSDPVPFRDKCLLTIRRTNHEEPSL